MKATVLFIITVFTAQSLCAQIRTPNLTVYKEYKPSVILLKDGRTLKQPFTNIFLKNSSLLYMSAGVAKEANIDNIVSVEFDNRTYIKIDTLLAYQVDSIGHDALFCATVIDQEAYRQNIKNNNVLTDISIGEQLGTTSIDLNNEEDYLFPLINIYYYRIDGKFVRCHERSLSHILDKEKKRIMRTFVTLPDFSWTDEQSLLKLLKGIQ